MKTARPPIWTADFVLLNLINITYSFGFLMMLPIMPLYLVFRGGSGASVGIVAASFSASAIVMRFICPLLLAKIKKTTLQRLGVLLSVCVTASCVFTAQIPLILTMRVLQGVAFGIVTTVVATLVANLLPDSRRGEGIGYFGMGNVLMAALSPALGLVLVEEWGFSSAFLVASAGQLITVLLLAFFRPQPETVAPSSIQKGSEETSFISRVYDKSLSFQTILLVFFGMVRTAEMNYMPLLARQRHIGNLPLFYICQTATSFLSRFVAANLYDRKGRSFVIVPGSLLLLLSLVFFVFAQSIGVLLLGAVCNGAGLGILQPAMQTWCMNTVTPDKRAVASAVFYNFYDLGITSFSAILGLVASKGGYGQIYSVALVPAALFVICYFLSFLKSSSKFAKKD